MEQLDSTILATITGGTGRPYTMKFKGPSGTAYMDDHGRLRVRLNDGIERDFHLRSGHFFVSDPHL